jgi:hypothetical protein
MQKESLRKTLDRVEKDVRLEELFKSLKPAQFHTLCILEEYGCHKKKKGMSSSAYERVNRSTFTSSFPSHVANVRKVVGFEVILCAPFSGRLKKYWLNSDLGEYQAFLVEKTRRFGEAKVTNLSAWLASIKRLKGSLESQEEEEEEDLPVEISDNYRVPVEYLQSITKGLSFAAVTVSWEPANATSGGSKGSISKEISAELLTEILQKLM